MAELLLELHSEEIPARMQKRAADDLERLVTERLKKAGIAFASSTAHVTPRRLALAVDGLPERQPDVSEERRGPRADAPERAIQGFLGAAGLTLEQCERRDTGKGVFLFAVIERKGAATRDVLPALLVEAIRELPWPKSMRWADNSFRWVRPLHSVIALLDGEPLDGGLDLGGRTLAFGCETRGHRFLAPQPFAVTGFADYRAKLRDAWVILDREARKTVIRDEAGRLAAAAGLALRDDPGLLDEVAGLVEWPVPLIGTIDPAFMDLPPEVMVTSMRTHQRYFALEGADGALANRFVVVANMAHDATRDATIVAGNERVLRARLSDAKFFWDQDRAATLEQRVPRLAAVTFYDRLGTMADKVARLRRLARHLAAAIPGCDPDHAERAALLAKADLVTGMVGEFPELQGVMGRYYARHDGEPEAVADAIARHYQPQGPSDDCPTAPASVAVALADKLDTLVGFFAIDEKPTGSRDPYALRRAALGVIRLVLENRLRLPLAAVFKAAHALYPGLPEPAGLLDFFADRLKVHLREQGVRHDLVAAVFALGGEDDLVRLIARAEALQAFLGGEDGINLLTGYRRAANIVRIEEKKDGRAHDGAVSAAALAEPAEQGLFAALEAAGPALATHLASDGFENAMGVLATLRGPIDHFFDAVTVNAEDAGLRENRLRFLSGIVRTMDRVADFSKVEG
jgi:glycyl-tRNA synthetase beta chain